ncbi:uncharacterized protein LOC134754023 [Cydia strobilella]|uniref:uncharacterized protein LOC134754023 n=1 Tax=Cydia strobilella TaxID=1100964 RepID=UPI0030071F66
MMYKKYTALVLALVVLSAEASTAPKQMLAPLLLQAQQEKLSELGITATVNDYVDETISMLAPHIQNFGLDPMELPDIEEGFEVRYLLLTYSAWLKIHDGYMTGLVNVQRSGDQSVNYFAKMLRVRVVLQFSDLEFIYKYLLKVMRIGPTGGIRGSLDNFKVITDILIDFNNDEIHLQQFSLTDVGRLRVRLTGNILTDWLINPTIAVFVRLFDTIIIKVVEVNIRNAIHTGIGIINSNLKAVIDVLESFN